MKAYEMLKTINKNIYILLHPQKRCLKPLGY